MSFTVAFQERDFSADLVPPSLELTVSHYGFTAQFGPKEAVITAFGDETSLWQLIDMLRVPIIIYDDETDPVWWGYIAQVEVRIGWINIGVSLDEMANSVSIAYTSFKQRKTTAWASSFSTSIYGTKQLRLSATDVTDAQATAYRDTELESRKYPVPSFQFGQGTEGGFSATITCRGWTETLDWKYYEQSKGLEQYDAEGSGQVKIGMYLTGSTISFSGASLISDSACNLAMFDKGDIICIRGSVAANNGTWTVAEGTSAGDQIAIDNVSASKNLTTSGAGSSITISSGVEIAQRFSQDSGSSWDISSIHLRIQKSGSPTDSFVARLYSDSASLPSSVLASGSVAASDLSETMTWTEIPLSACVTAISGSKYWVGGMRSACTSGSNFYKIDVNEEVGYSKGFMKISNGSAWSSRGVDADLTFKVVGTQNTTEQIREIVQSAGQFFKSIDISASSGIETNQWRQGDTTALTEITGLLDTGTVNKRRLFIQTSASRRIKIVEEPAKTQTETYRVQGDRTIKNYSNTPIKLSKCPVGIWVTLADVLPANMNTERLSNATDFFVEEAEYTPGTNTYVPRSRNVSDVWALNAKIVGG